MDTSWQHILRQIYWQDKLRVGGFFAGKLNHVRVFDRDCGEVKHGIEAEIVGRVKHCGRFQDCVIVHLIDCLSAGDGTPRGILGSDVLVIAA
jgi:hypothetical protein